MNTSTDTNRFTAEGDPAVEQTIADMLRRLADDIRRLADSDHVAIYLGGGRIVHAASTRQGICIGNNAAYTKILSIRRFL
jgi:uridylate kinase